MIKVTLEFENVDAAIVGLSKLVAVPLKVASESARKSDSAAQAPGTATKPPRRGRSDKGQPRGSYSHGQNAGAAGSAAGTDNGAAPAGVLEVTDAGKATVEVANLTSTVSGPVSVAPAPEPAAPASSSGLTHEITQSSTVVATGAAVPKIGDAQAAIAKLFETKGLSAAMDCLSRYGAKAVRELKPEHYAPFIADVNAALGVA